MCESSVVKQFNQPRTLSQLETGILRDDYRNNPTSKNFIETIWKDEVGDRIVIADIHEVWHDFIRDRRAEGVNRIGLLAPYKYGKTPHILGYTLYEISNNRNLRCKFVCNDDFNAKKRVSLVKQYIEYDEDYKVLFGDYIKPDKEGWWTKNAIQVKRDGYSIDATFESASVLSAGIGGTFDLILFDDPCDLNNSVLSPARRESVMTAVNDVWLSRLDADGFVLYIGTTWHEQDITHDLLERPGWAWHLTRIKKDFSCLEYIWYVND